MVALMGMLLKLLDKSACHKQSTRIKQTYLSHALLPCNALFLDRSFTFNPVKVNAFSPIKLLSRMRKGCQKIREFVSGEVESSVRIVMLG